MTSVVILLLLAAAASTIAFTPHQPLGHRFRREVASSTPSGSVFSSSGSFSGSGALPGSFLRSGGYSGSGGSGSYNAGSQSAPLYPDNGNQGQYPYYPYRNPYVHFGYDQYQQFLEHMRRMSLQHQAFVSNYFGGPPANNYLDNNLPGFYGSGSSFGAPSSGGGYPDGFGNGYNGGYRGSYGGGFPAGASTVPTNGLNGGGSPSNGGAAVAQANITPQGGHGEAGVYDGLGLRLGFDSGDTGPAGGGNYGVFTSSSSGSSNVDGKTTSYKHSTSTINDNGKVTTFTAHDP